MKAKSLLLLLALSCLVATAAAQQDGGGSAPQVPVVNTSSSSGAPSLDGMGVKKYLLGPGDVLDLRVYNEPQFNGTLIVNDEGMLEVPFVETPILAQCRNDREIKQDVIKALAKYLNKPQVSLQVREMRSRPPAVVFGAVRSPSRVQMQRRAHLLDLLATSGGITEAAGGDVQIFHTEPVMCPEPEEVVSVPMDSYKPSDPTQIGYDIYSVRELKDGKKEANPVIRPGDIVIVQEALPVYIMGAVRSPQGLYLKNGMQLKQAIAMVGGLNKEAKASSVVIWRKKKGQPEPEKLIINYNDIKKEKAKDIDLQPYDIVEVPDNSGSALMTLRGMLMGTLGSSVTTFGQTVVPRVIY
ncbi:MAG: polysaccharide biosynthesis/export protein [Acidobacteriota bacterium]|jgi:polysaccharide export outer membrane protein|nr:polysaccharide biosynthesis/export protein [Acidobacteriota bacterium]